MPSTSFGLSFFQMMAIVEFPGGVRPNFAASSMRIPKLPLLQQYRGAWLPTRTAAACTHAGKRRAVKSQRQLLLTSSSSALQKGANGEIIPFLHLHSSITD